VQPLSPAHCSIRGWFDMDSSGLNGLIVIEAFIFAFSPENSHRASNGARPGRKSRISPNNGI